MTTVLLDTHTLLWWTVDSSRLSRTALDAVSGASELALASVSWFELAWMAAHNRFEVSTPIRSWLESLGEQVRTVATTPAIAATAVALPRSFPGDPADRIIYATALEQGWVLVTKDERLLRHPHTPAIAIW